MKKLLVITLIICIMILTTLVGFAKANLNYQEFIDIEGHWAEKVITDHHKKGLISGYPNGTFKPDKEMKRSELVTLINQYFGLKVKADDNFIDVSAEEWYASETAIAKYYGYLKELEARPEALAKREDVVRMMSLLLDIEEQENRFDKKEFTDLGEVDKDTKNVIEKFSQIGYIRGYSDGSFRPNGIIRRAEILTLLESMLGYIVTSQEDIDNMPVNVKKVTVINPNIIIENKQIKGDLYISPGVNGRITIKNTSIDGQLFVSGGSSENPIHLDNVDVEKVVITKSKNKTRLEIIGKSNVRELKTKVDAEIEISGETEIRRIITQAKTKAKLDSGTNVKRFIVEGITEVEMEHGSKIEYLEVEERAKITGQGNISVAEIRSNNVAIENRPEYIELENDGITVKLDDGVINSKNDDKKEESDKRRKHNDDDNDNDNNKQDTTVENVTTTAMDGAYKSGETIEIQVEFDKTVTVTGTPQLTLETGTIDQVIDYTSGTGTRILRFSYIVQAGDTSNDLDYINETALGLNGGTIIDQFGKDAVLTLPTPGMVNSLGYSKEIVIDTQSPMGPVISIFTHPINNTNEGSVVLSGTAEANTKISYTISSNAGVEEVTGIIEVDGSGDYTKTNIDVSSLGDGTITVVIKAVDEAGNESNRVAKTGIKETQAPEVMSITPIDEQIEVDLNSDITIVFNQSLDTSAAGEVRLVSPEVTFMDGTNSNMSFTTTSILNDTVVISPNSNLEEGKAHTNITISGFKDVVGNEMNTYSDSGYSFTTLSIPGAVENVTTTAMDGAYKSGETIEIQVEFDKTVTVTGTPQLTLETGTIDQVIDYTSGTGTRILRFSYIVQAGDTSNDLDYINETALGLNGGTIIDQFGKEAVLTLPTPGMVNSLGYSKEIVIDTQEPSVVNITPIDGEIDIDLSSKITIVFNESLDTSATGEVSFVSPSVTFKDGINSSMSFTTTSILNDTVVISPNSNLEEGETYSDIAVSNFEDVAGNQMNNYNDARYDFTTIILASIPDDYLARWKFENDLSDETGIYDAIVLSGTPAFSSSDSREGDFSLNIYEEGISPNNQIPEFVNDSISMSAWFYADSSATGMPTVVEQDGIMAIYYDYGNMKIVGELLYSQAKVEISNVNRGMWYHVVVTYDGGELRIFLNGGNQTERVSIFDDISLEGPTYIYIGSSNGNYYWKGYIDDVILYDRALNIDEVSNIYNSYK